MCGGGSLPLSMNVAAGRACLHKGKAEILCSMGTSCSQAGDQAALA
jgi:hypothetical protein